MTTETWLTVVDYEGYYEVSDQGRVRSTDRTCMSKSRSGRSFVRHLKGRIRRPTKSGKGRYLALTLSKDNKQSVQYVHRLVLEAFVGPCPEGMETRHFPDRSTSNNKLSNLSWSTHTENLADKLVHGTHDRGEKSVNAKVTSSDIGRIFALRVAGHTQREIGDQVGLSQRQVYDILIGRCWGHMGYVLPRKLDCAICRPLESMPIRPRQKTRMLYLVGTDKKMAACGRHASKLKRKGWAELSV